MLAEKFKDALKHEGVVTIVSWDESEPHLVNTWNSYLVVTADERILIPAAGMRKTEKNIHLNGRIKLALGSKEVIGFHDYQGTGFVVEGTAKFLNSGADYDMMKAKFPFLSRVLEVTVISAEQKI